MSITLLRAENGFKHYKTSAINLNGLNESASIDVFNVLGGSWSVVWDSVVGAADIEIQVSHDAGLHWDTVAGSSITTSGASGSGGYKDDQIPGALLKMKVTSAATSGVATLYFLGKEDVS